jgi:hypothetical protein
MATPVPNSNFISPTEILNLHPMLKNRYNWTEKGIGWLLSMNLLEGQRINKCCKIYYPSVVIFIKSMNLHKNWQIPLND